MKLSEVSRGELWATGVYLACSVLLGSLVYSYVDAVGGYDLTDNSEDAVTGTILGLTAFVASQLFGRGPGIRLLQGRPINE